MFSRSAILTGAALAVLAAAIGFVLFDRGGKEPIEQVPSVQSQEPPEELEEAREADEEGLVSDQPAETQEPQEESEMAPPVSPPPVQVEPPPQTQEPQTVSRTVEADDNGLYPATMSVPQGATVNLAFKVRSTNVYYGGLDFRSTKFVTNTVLPGGQTTVTFTADATFTYASYWPASGVKKADGTVVVE